MAPILEKRRTVAGIALVSVGILVLGSGAVCGSWTGYAFGNRNGAYNVEVFAGNVAGHPAGTCNDESWGNGSVFLLANNDAVPIPDASGVAADHTLFVKRDTGDWFEDDPDGSLGLSCTEEPHWVDVYFGRWKPEEAVCDCPGSPNSVCDLGQTNSCTNAQQYGREQKVYDLVTLPPCGC